MISQFNRTQTILGIANLVAGVLALALTAGVFYLVSQFALSRFGVVNPIPISLAVAAGALVIVFATGINLQRKGQGHYGYQDSGMMPNWNLSSGGSFMVDYYRNRVTAPTHAFSQLFLCGPLQVIGGLKRFRSRLPAPHGIESRLESLLGEIESKEKWETVHDYPEQAEELQFLIHMDKIQFSPRTGKIRSN